MANDNALESLEMDRYITGLVTQRSALRDASVPYLTARYNSGSRYDSFYDGINGEITADLTFGRRPGHSVYNSQTFPRINRFYEFETVIEGVDGVRVMVDCASTVYDGTGPNTKTAIWQKSPGAGKTTFQSVGNTLYFGNGVDQKKWILSNLLWKPNRLSDGPDTSNTTLGDFIVDKNQNIQKAVGSFTLNITNVQVSNNVLTLQFDQAQLDNPSGKPLGTAGTGGSLPTGAIYAKVVAGNALGLLTAAGDESLLTAVVGPNGSIQWVWAAVPGATFYRIYVGNTPGSESSYFTSDTNSFNQTLPAGTAGTPPTVNNAFDDSLPDNLQFMVGVKLALSNLGTATFLDGQTITIAGVLPGGLNSNIVTAALTHADYPSTADSGSATSGTGITGGVEPAWATNQGDVTQDGGAQWINRGNYVQNWGILAPTKAPAITQQSASQGVPSWSANTYYTTSNLIWYETGGTQYIFEVTTFGATGGTQPAFDTTTGNTTTDNTVVWTCRGPAAYATSTAYSAGSYILQTASDGKLYFYQSQNDGTSGSSAPTFSAPLGSIVDDNGIKWKNIGVGQQWSDITAAALASDFTIIPLAGGGSIALGAGNGAYGTVVALPTGYSASNAVIWTSPCSGYDLANQIKGVDSSTAVGGLLQSAFARRSSGQTTASSNWAALAWTNGAAVSVSVVGAFTQVSFTTEGGDQMVVTYGQLNHGSVVPTPSGFLSSEFVYIIGMSGTQSTSHGLHGVDPTCALDSSLTAYAQYNDNVGNRYPGAANVFGIFWKSGGGVTPLTVTGGTGIAIPTSGGNQVAVFQTVVPSGGTFDLPAGYDNGSYAATCAMNDYPIGTGGSQVSHGWVSQLIGRTYTGTYSDGSGVYTTGGGNIFGMAAPVQSTTISPSKQVNDTNGNLQQLQDSGTSSTSSPTWATTTGTLTIDNAATWLNVGAGTAAQTGGKKYYYSFANDVDVAESSLSPASITVVRGAGKYNYITGLFSNDPQVTTVKIYATAQNGSIPFYLDEIPNVIGGTNNTWSYADKGTDADLTIEIQGDLTNSNAPPPVGLTNLEYHANRMWGTVNNQVYYATGPDVKVGNPNTAWNPGNYFSMPTSVSRLYSVSLNEGAALLEFTKRDVRIIRGSTKDTFASAGFAAGIGLMSYDAFDVIGGTIYMFTSSRKLISLDPSTGYSEPGYLIGDQFKRVTTGGINATLYNPTSTYVTWHEQDSGDTGLFVADGSVGWFRYSPTTAPESGFVWNPRAAIEGGTSAVQSITKQLLIGPHDNGPILCRDSSTNADNNIAYSDFYVDIGSIQFCSPGQLAEIHAVTLDSKRIGTAPTCGMLFGELHETDAVPFDMLNRDTEDPPNLSASVTIFNDRFYTLQNGQVPVCRHAQLRIQWSVENAANELLTHTFMVKRYAENP